MPINYKLNSEKLEELMSERGINSYYQLSEKIGIHRNTIREYLVSENSVLPKGIYKIASFFEVDPLTLLSSKQEESDYIGRLRKLLQPLPIKYPQLAFLIIGSRARGNNQKYSDIDLAISSGQNPISVDNYLTVKLEIEDLVEDFPLSVDVVNLDSAPRWFIEEIDYQPIFLSGNKNAYYFNLGLINGIKRE